MRVALRPYVTSGIALVGAGVIAVTPIEPAPDFAVRSTHEVVQLTANPTVFDVYAGLVQRSVENLGDRAADAAPVFERLVDYPLGAVTDVATAIETGDGELLFATLAKAVTEPVGAIIKAPITFVTDYALSMALALAVWPVANAALSTVFAVRDVLEAIENSDVIDLFNAVVTIPGKIIHGVVNGITDWDVPNASGVAGLLNEGPTDPIGGNFLKGPVFQAISFLDDVVPEWTSPAESSQPASVDVVPESDALTRTTLLSDPATAEPKVSSPASLDQVAEPDGATTGAGSVDTDKDADAEEDADRDEDDTSSRDLSPDSEIDADRATDQAAESADGDTSSHDAGEPSDTDSDADGK